MAYFNKLLFALLFLVLPAHAHKCVHDEYVHSKKIKATVSPQSYPFEMREGADARRLQSENWEPIRIHVDTSDIDNRAFGGAAQATLNRITSSILGLAIEVLTNHLSVVRTNENVKITPYCPYSIGGVDCCGTNPSCVWDANTCVDIPVPASHESVGIPNTDFVLYLTANEDQHPGGSSDTMASAAACRDDQNDRPIAGKIQIYLANWEESFSQNYMVSVLIHEISHALGWSAEYFPKFRDENGNLRGNAVTTTNSDRLGKTISLLSTPAVTSQVRSHFGCDSLTGMEIEDQGGSGTAGSHAEMRIFPDSYMAGTSAPSGPFVIDAMALSVFQDSGWYQVENLDQAGQLSWGRGMGCRVPKRKCDDWGDEANAQGLFCDDAQQSFCTGSNKQVKGHCDLSEYYTSLPSMFQYFSSPVQGGNVQIADFCPRVAQYSNGDCTDASFQTSIDEYRGAEYGSDSRCFQSSLLIDGVTSSDNSVNGGCYRRTCQANALQIHVGDRIVSCPVSNQASSVTPNGYDGVITCPPYSGLSDARCTPICSQDDLECLGSGAAAAPPTTTASPPTAAPTTAAAPPTTAEPTRRKRPTEAPPTTAAPTTTATTTTTASLRTSDAPASGAAPTNATESGEGDGTGEGEGSGEGDGGGGGRAVVDDGRCHQLELMAAAMQFLVLVYGS